MSTDETISAQEAIKRWDQGDILVSIEMGGMGPGYEQTIQTCAIEILRDALIASNPLTEETFRDLADITIHFHNESLGGLSGAQAGAAISLAWQAFSLGWSGMLERAKEAMGPVEFLDRRIMVSGYWPRARLREKHLLNCICNFCKAH
jgi:hypothetical protein